MSSMPECKLCGNYPMHGECLCGYCSQIITCQRDEAVRLLRKHEWCGRKCVCKKDDYWISYCQECKEELPNHKPDCAIGKLLKEAPDDRRKTD